MAKVVTSSYLGQEYEVLKENVDVKAFLNDLESHFYSRLMEVNDEWWLDFGSHVIFLILSDEEAEEMLK